MLHPDSKCHAGLLLFGPPCAYLRRTSAHAQHALHAHPRCTCAAQTTMTAGSIFFLIGVGLTSGAVEIAMLVIGRLMLGFGIGVLRCARCATRAVLCLLHWPAYSQPLEGRACITYCIQLNPPPRPPPAPCHLRQAL